MPALLCEQPFRTRRHLFWLPPLSINYESFIWQAQRLEEQGQTDAGLDVIYNTVDDFLCREQFDALDSILASIRAHDLSTDILLGILTATLPADNRLASRQEMYRSAKNVLKERGEDEETLLSGLRRIR